MIQGNYSTIPLISIVIANYNKEKYIEASLDSVLRQTFRNIEIIVVDDGSTDQSVKILKSMQRQDNRLKVFFLSHIGKVKAFNFGVSKAIGDFIKIWSSDDILLPSAIENLTVKIHGYDVVIHDCSIGDEQAKVIQSSFIDFSKNSNKISTISDVIQEHSFPSHSYLIKKSLFNNIFPIPEEATYEDWYITLMFVINNARIYTYQKPLSIYRQVKNSAYNGVNNYTRKTFLYRTNRNIQMLRLFRKILPPSYFNEIDDRILYIKLTSSGSIMEIINSSFSIAAKFKILLKRYFYYLFFAYYKIRSTIFFKLSN